MFCGTFFHTIDDKGRVAIPRGFRDLIVPTESGEVKLVITRGISDKRTRIFLDIYSVPEWDDLIDRVRRLPQFRESTRAFREAYIRPCHRVTLDGQGRLLLPPNLREYIGSSREAVFTGDIEKFQLWTKPDWERSDEESMDKVCTPGYLDDIGL